MDQSLRAKNGKLVQVPGTREQALGNTSLPRESEDATEIHAVWYRSRKDDTAERYFSKQKQ